MEHHLLVTQQPMVAKLKGKNMDVKVNWVTCYIQSQCRDERIRGASNQGLKALRLVTRLQYAWPGGYEMYAITADGDIVCADCLKAEYELYYRSTRNNERDGYAVDTADAECNIDGKVYCDICGKHFGMDED
jgi:hypothetical protein